MINKSLFLFFFFNNLLIIMNTFYIYLVIIECHDIENTYTEIDILTCNVVWWVVFCGRCKCAVKIAMAAPVASREG